MQTGDILTQEEVAYVHELEHLWDMLSDTVEDGRLTEADIPDDYDALVEQMMICERCNAAVSQAQDADE